MSPGTAPLPDGSAASLLRWLLVTAPAEGERPDDPGSLGAWWEAHRAGPGRFPVPIDRAIAGAFAADRMAYAFAGAYQAALRSLIPDLPPERLASLSITEEGGGHPRAIRTTLAPVEGQGGTWELRGHKRFATLSPQGELLVVAASTGTGEDGRNRIRMALVPGDAPGVTITPMPPIGFLPELEHGEVELDAVRVGADALLEGDGYVRYVRPFRTVEDLFVLAAAMAHVLGIAFRAGWPREASEQLAGLIVQTRALALEDPSDPGVHLALGGLFTTWERTREGFSDLWQEVDAVEPGLRERWERDSAFTSIAGKARAARLERAWARLRPGPDGG